MRRIISMALCLMMITVTVTGCKGSETASASKGNSKTVTSVSPAGNTSVSSGGITSVEYSSGSGETTEIVEIVEVEIPKLAKDQILVMDAVGLSVKTHADAMIWTEKLSRAAEDNSLSDEEKMEVLDNCIEAWRIADVVSKKAENMADLLSQAEEKPEYQYTTTMVIKVDRKGNLYGAIKDNLIDNINDLLFIKVYAADGKSKIDAKTWAENITKAYDEGKNGQKLKNIANMMGLNGNDKEDCRKAYKALQTAQGIMKGTYEGEQAEKEAATWNNLYKTAKVLKTSGKVAGFAAGFLSLGATTGLTGALELGGVAVDGIDATLEVMDTGAMLILGDNNSVSVKAQDLGSKLAPVSSVLSAANAGKTLIGLDWSGGLSAINKGLSDNNGYGIISFLGNGIADYMDDKKFVGGAFTKGNDGSLKCNLVQIYSNAKPEEKEKIKEQLKEAGFKDEAITEILKPASAATDESTLISFEELTPEQLDEISIMTDVISEENNPEKTVDELAKEMKDIIKDTYDIVVGGDLTKYAGVYKGTGHITCYVGDESVHDSYVERTKTVKLKDGELYGDGNTKIVLDESGRMYIGHLNPSSYINWHLEYTFSESSDGTMHLYLVRKWYRGKTIDTETYELVKVSDEY